MDPVIAIPTKDRLDSLDNLVSKLQKLSQNYSHNPKIVIFDDSETDSAKEIARDRRVDYFGSEKRNKLIMDVGSFLGKDVRYLFSGTIGGNRNSILFTYAGEKLIMIDDDMDPVSLVPVGAAQKGNIRKDDIKLGDVVITDTFEEVEFDLLSEMLMPLGKKPADSSLKKTTGCVPRRHHVVGRPTELPNNPVAITYAMSSYFADYDAGRDDCDSTVGFRNLEPVFCRGAVYGCVAMDGQSTFVFPCVPTSHRYEDILHSHMIFMYGLGNSFCIGKDVKHNREGRSHLDRGLARLSDILSDAASLMNIEFVDIAYDKKMPLHTVMESMSEDDEFLTLKKEVLEVACETYSIHYSDDLIPLLDVEYELARETFTDWNNILFPK